VESVASRFAQMMQVVAVTRHIAETAIEVARDAVQQSSKTNALCRLTRARSQALQAANHRGTSGQPVP
jgi:hypothetical protein